MMPKIQQARSLLFQEIQGWAWMEQLAHKNSFHCRRRISPRHYQSNIFSSQLWWCRNIL